MKKETAWNCKDWGQLKHQESMELSSEGTMSSIANLRGASVVFLSWDHASCVGKWLMDYLPLNFIPILRKPGILIKKKQCEIRKAGGQLKEQESTERSCEGTMLSIATLRGVSSFVFLTWDHVSCVGKWMEYLRYSPPFDSHHWLLLGSWI